MNIIVACPGCQKPTLVKAGSGHQSEVVLTEKKRCVSCGKDLEIEIKVKAKLKQAETAKTS